MSNDPAGLDELPSAPPLDDRIAAVTGRPLPRGAQELLLDLAPEPSSEETIYLSTPITTGPKLLDWLSQNGESPTAGSPADAVRDEVVRDNLARLAPLRDRVRAEHPGVHLIDPTEVEVPGWTQADYHRFWIEVIRNYVDRIVFADGWELSTGCVIEYATGLELGLPSLDAAGKEIRPTSAATALRRASAILAKASRDGSIPRDAAFRAEVAGAALLKDAELVSLAESYNVASFASFTPGQPILRFGVLAGPSFRRALGVEGAIESILSTSRAGRVNVRTFRPNASKGNPFYYGLATVGEVLGRLNAAAAEGFYCIVNETIDIHDGGVSGVTLGGVAEFAPDDTPRAVERGDTARLPLAMAEHILRKVYGDGIVLPAAPDRRIEFSVHPVRTGYRRQNVIVWETEEVSPVELEAEVVWPNRFSELVGDKTFGLLVADAIGMPVPAVTVINRRVAPFRFGRPTGTGEWWMRTAPARQTPGHFTTTRGWSDPFAVVTKEDPDGSVASVLAQEGVDAHFSGATLPRSDGAAHIIEGVLGTGDAFMLGEREASDLPASVVEMVTTLLSRLEYTLGAGVRIEWAVDGEHVWVLQLHRARGGSEMGVFNPGTASTWLPFDPSDGLEVLAGLVARAREISGGIEVTKAIGLTSHVGDILRQAGVPGRLRVAGD